MKAFSKLKKVKTGSKHLESSSLRKGGFLSYLKRYWILYLFLIPALIDTFLFKYGPMYGIIIAFKDFIAKRGIWGSEWVGLKHFVKFIKSPIFLQILTNTLSISVRTLLFSFPVPIILAIMLNELRNQKLKKTVQMITYMPHFISVTAVVGLIRLVTDPQSGILNMLVVALGGEAQNYMAMDEAFLPIYIISEIWQHMGWNTIIYLSALSAVDVESIEAATVDGANRLQKIWHIDIPTILPTIIILLIMNAGRMMSVGFEKVFLLQNDLNRSVSEIISTYTYRLGIIGGQFSYTTAIGLFNNIINMIILCVTNYISKKTSETSLW